MNTFNVKDILPEILLKRFGKLSNTPSYNDNVTRVACEEAIIVLKQLLRTKILHEKSVEQFLSKCFVRD